MTCESQKQDSNITGLSYAEEECLRQLPATPVWYGMEPNSYADFGGELSAIARSPIDPSRQNKKGTITDLDASGGFNTDFTQNNLFHLMQGFFFADARERTTTAPLNGAKLTVTDVDATDNVVTLSGPAAGFAAGNLVQLSQFASAGNNGIKLIEDVVGDAVTLDGSLQNEGASATAVIRKVGFQFQAGESSITVVDGVVTLTNTTTQIAGLDGVYPGSWVFLGSDLAAGAFANNVGYGRVRSVAGAVLTFDEITWNAENEVGTGKSIQLYVGDMIRNEFQPSLIKRRSYHVERTLGSDEDGEQAEYLTGAVANEFTLNIAQADKLTADVSFVACDNLQVTGQEGLIAGTRVPALGEDAYNTSLNIYRIHLAQLTGSTSMPKALFGYTSEGSISINNNITPNKAVGVLGAFDTSAGNFEVSGSITAYFTTTAAVKAVRNNADVGLNVIGAARNAGFVFDIPLLSLGGGRVAVEKDQPITVPVEPSGAQSKFGYTMSYTRFNYLPNAAMPT